MTLTLTNLSTGDTLTLRGVRPTSDDLAALITLEGIGLIAKFESDGRYGLTSGKRINAPRFTHQCHSTFDGLDCVFLSGHPGKHQHAGTTWQDITPERPPLTPFGEQLVKIARGE